MRSELLPSSPVSTLRRLLVDASGESPIAFAIGAGGVALLLAGTLQAFEPELAGAYKRVAYAFAIDQAEARDEPTTTASFNTRSRPRVSPALYGNDKYLREYK